jgi:hypothetical protein
MDVNLLNIIIIYAIKMEFVKMMVNVFVINVIMGHFVNNLVMIFFF